MTIKQQLYRGFGLILIILAVLLLVDVGSLLKAQRASSDAASTLEGVRTVENVRISEELKRYCVDLVAATRTAAGVQLGASPRASISLMKTAQAEALFDGNDFVAPEQIQKLAVSVIAHRIVLEPQARFSGVTQRGVVEEILKKLKVPA